MARGCLVVMLIEVRYGTVAVWKGRARGCLVVMLIEVRYGSGLEGHGTWLSGCYAH